jgi:hypothetical protein
MKYARLLLIFAVLLTSGHATLSAASSADEAEARAVLLRYFDALAQGDVLTLRSLLGGDLLEKRYRLLNNPSYPAHLVETYKQAHFRIDQYTVLNEDTIAAEVVIVLSPDENVEKRFLLIREARSGLADSRYLISDEQFVTR